MPTDRKSAATRFWFHLDKYGVAPGESFELMLSTVPNERVAHIVGNLIDTCASICIKCRGDMQLRPPGWRS